MTAPVTPPWKPSHFARNAWIGLITVMVVLAVVGSITSRPANDTAAATPPPGAASEEPSEEPTPTPVGQTLLSLKGTGMQTSDTFGSSGEAVDVTYDYTCAEPGSFEIDFYGTNSSQLLPDIVVNDFAAQGSDTVTENLNGAAGPFHIEVVTGCDWTIEVVGQP